MLLLSKIPLPNAQCCAGLSAMLSLPEPRLKGGTDGPLRGGDTDPTDTKGLVKAADGSITIPIQADPPGGAAAANWLPAPKGTFYALLRLYQPKADVLNGLYQLPQVRKVP